MKRNVLFVTDNVNWAFNARTVMDGSKLRKIKPLGPRTH